MGFLCFFFEGGERKWFNMFLYGFWQFLVMFCCFFGRLLVVFFVSGCFFFVFFWGKSREVFNEVVAVVAVGLCLGCFSCFFTCFVRFV